MKRRDRVSSPVRCYCTGNGETIDEHGHFARGRISERVAEYVLVLRRALRRKVYRERSLAWMLSRAMFMLAAVAAIVVLVELGKTTEPGMNMSHSERINALKTMDRNAVVDSGCDPLVQSIRHYFCQ